MLYKNKSMYGRGEGMKKRDRGRRLFGRELGLAGRKGLLCHGILQCSCLCFREARQERERMADELFGILTGEEKEQLYPLLEKLADAWAADEAKQGEGIK